MILQSVLLGVLNKLANSTRKCLSKSMPKYDEIKHIFNINGKKEVGIWLIFAKKESGIYCP